MATITNYTTYDMASYYADVKRIPRLTEEERQSLMSDTTPEQLAQARIRLIEGHLQMAIRIALKVCPPTHYQSLPDLIGTVNLTLVKLAQQYNFAAGYAFTPYFAVCAEGAIRRAIGDDRLIRIPGSAIWKAKQHGTEKHLYELQPDSLDQWMEWFQTSEVEEPPTTSLLPTEAAPPRDPHVRMRVQTWLSYLPPRAQKVLTLRYGLSDEDESCWTVGEIAHELGVPRSTIEYIERDAKQRIRALAEGTAIIVEKNGQCQIKGVHTHAFKPPTLTAEQEAIFLQATTRLCEQGVTVSGRALASATGLGVNHALVFLRLYRDALGLTARQKVARQQTRLAQVAQAYTALVASGEHITGKRLAQAAHVGKASALAFLRTQKEECDAA